MFSNNNRSDKDDHLLRFLKTLKCSFFSIEINSQNNNLYTTYQSLTRWFQVRALIYTVTVCEIRSNTNLIAISMKSKVAFIIMPN